MTTSKFQDIQANGIDLEHVEPVKTNGATCDTYRMRLFGKLHFLKRLKPELAFDPRYTEAFKKEFLTGYNLNHPNLVGYVLNGNDAQGPFMLLDYIEGETLSEKINNSPSYFENKDNLNKFLRQLLSCLSYLHSNQVVHLDLKPDNIILTKVGNDVKVLDLGFCYTDGYNTTMGKSDDFAAPEQKDGSGDVDARTDIYAVGKILQLIDSKSPYIYRCINPDKSKRFQSADEMLSAINKKAKKTSLVLVALAIVSILIAFIFSKALNTETEITSVTNHVTDPTFSSGWNSHCYSVENERLGEYQIHFLSQVQVRNGQVPHYNVCYSNLRSDTGNHHWRISGNIPYSG